jgi:hypothetical protein
MTYTIPKGRTLEIVYEVECEDECHEFDHQAEAEAELCDWMKLHASEYPNVKRADSDRDEQTVELSNADGDTLTAYIRKVCYLVDDLFGGRDKVENGIYD